MNGEPPAFDDDGAVVPVVGFPYDLVDGEQDPQAVRDSGEVFNRLLDLLVEGAATPEVSGRRAWLLAYVVRRPASKRSLRKLGRAFGVSGPRAHRLLTALRRKLASLSKD